MRAAARPGGEIAAAFAMLTTIFPASWGARDCAIVAAESHGVAITTMSQSAATVFSPYPTNPASSGCSETIWSRVSIARYFDREPISTS